MINYKKFSQILIPGLDGILEPTEQKTVGVEVR